MLLNESFRVVAVDDSPDDLELLRLDLSELADWTIEFHPFENPQSTLDRIVSINPHLVFLDNRMGVYKGSEILAKIRDKGIDCPAVFLTSMTAEEISKETIGLENWAFISKDELTSERLRETIQHFYESS